MLTMAAEALVTCLSGGLPKPRGFAWPGFLLAWLLRLRLRLGLRLRLRLRLRLGLRRKLRRRRRASLGRASYSPWLE